MSGSKNALGTYKYIGIITDGSPIYSYEFNDEGSFRVTYIFREFRGNENKKIWTGRVNSFFPLLIFGSVVCVVIFILSAAAPRNTTFTFQTHLKLTSDFEVLKSNDCKEERVDLCKEWSVKTDDKQWTTDYDNFKITGK